MLEWLVILSLSVFGILAIFILAYLVDCNYGYGDHNEGLHPYSFMILCFLIVPFISGAVATVGVIFHIFKWIFKL